MANTTIVLKKSGVPGNVPSVLANGELSINFADGKLYYRAANGTITSISGSGGGGSTNSFATVNANSSLILATSATDTLSIVPGNGISISTNTTSKTITINSTSSANIFSSNTINTLNMLANVANITTLNVVNHIVTGNSNVQSLSATSIFANNYYYANGTPLSTGGGGGTASLNGYAANTVLTANSLGYISNTTNLQFFSSNNTLVVTGNVVGGGVRTTSATTPPASPTTGDLWYNTTTDVMYRWTFDGTNYYWIDNVSSATASNGSLLQANVTYNSVTANTINVSTIYANTLNVIENNVTFTGNISSNSITTTSVYANSYYFANGSVLTTGSNVPKITGLVVTNSSYIANGWTAVSNTGGYMLINGSGFVAGATVLIGTKTASATGFVSANQLQVQVPAQADGTYPVYVTNPDGGVAISVPGLTYNDLPVWSTGSTLPSGVSNSAISIQLAATDTQTVTYSLASGSTLPTGLTLSSSGLLSGTVSTSVVTVYTFAVNAVDIYSQNTSQTFSITIVIGDTYFPYTSLLLSASTNSANTSGNTAANTVIDSSYNYNAITRTGNPGQGTFTPFGTNWSNYFNGSTDYLTTPANTAFAFGTGDFTIECWVYTNSSATQRIVSAGNAGGTPYDFVLVNTGSNVYVDFFDGTTDNTTGSNYVTQNQWVHLAVTRQGTALKLFINGVVSGSATNSVNLTAAGTLTIGRYSQAASGYFSGYISNLRMIKGTALYTAAFTPTTAPLSVVANTVLLTSQSNRFVDNSTANTGSGFTLTSSGNTSVQRFNPFGVNGVPYNTSANTYIGSTYFNGTTDYLTAGTSSKLALSSGNWTIDLWMYPTSVSVSQNIILDWRTSNNNQPVLYLVNAQVYWRVNQSQLITAGSVIANTWTHLALVKNSGTTTLYLNGISIASSADSVTYLNDSCKIGSDWSGVYFWNGYLSNVRLVIGTALYTANFTPSTTPSTVVANTVLLACQSTQTVTYDANTTPNSLTVTGTPRPTQRVPFSQSWAGQFNGSSAYLSIPNSTPLNLSSGSWTIECWIYPSNFTNYNVIVAKRISLGPSTSYEFYLLQTSGYLSFFNGTTTYSSTTAPLLNTWSHVAAVYNGANVTMYLNGTNIYSSATTITEQNSTLLIGYDGSSTDYFTGYISNLRILKGTAVYTSNFTPANTPLTAIANTILLTCQSGSNSNTFIDNSTNAFTITNNGTPGANVVSMAAPGYSPMPSIVDTSTAATIYSGSLYFNSSSPDYLTIPTGVSGATVFGTNNFTIEMWVYPTTSPNNIWTPFFSVGSPGSVTYGQELRIGQNMNNTGFGYLYPSANNAADIFYGFGTLPLNAWSHLALVRNGANMLFFFNGSLLSTQTAAFNFTNTGAATVNYDKYPDGNSNGYISNLRIVKGQALYTSAFTPPTAPFNPSANIAYSGPANTVLLLSGTNVGAYDSTMINDFINVGGVSVNSNVKQYGINSYYFNGASYLQSVTNPQDTFGSGNWTIETWVYLTAVGSNQHIIDFRNSGVATAVVPTIYISNTNFPTFWTNGSARITGSNALSASTWYHVALVKNGSTTTLYLNGNSQGTYSDTNTYTTGRITIGTEGDTVTNYLNGYLQDLRVTNGVARYTSNFTVPSTTFITQ